MLAAARARSQPESDYSLLQIGCGKMLGGGESRRSARRLWACPASTARSRTPQPCHEGDMEMLIRKGPKPAKFRVNAANHSGRRSPELSWIHLHWLCATVLVARRYQIIGIACCACARSGHRRRRAAEQRDEIAAPHSITSVASTSSSGGMVKPSALAVLRLMTNSSLVDCSTGKLAGLAPLKILSTYVAARRKLSARCWP
jgi:hypothetical protein